MEGAAATVSVKLTVKQANTMIALARGRAEEANRLAKDGNHGLRRDRQREAVELTALANALEGDA